MSTMSPIFESVTEAARYLARKPLLDRAWALRQELTPGIVFQPETEESVEDQIVETLWAEGKTLHSIAAVEEAEARTSFAGLAPGRESGRVSIVATLLLGFPAGEREQRLDRLNGFPEQLQLEMESGVVVTPEVDRGTAGLNDRLPAVLALRYLVPDGSRIVAIVSNHAEVSGRWSAPTAWSTWPSQT